MELYSTNKISPNVSLGHAVMTGLPPDNGLYLPTDTPQLPASLIDNLSDFSFQNIAFEVSKNLIGDEVDNSSLLKIITEAINFDAPVKQLDENLNVLELFHGPTLAFKDFGARFMSRLMQYFLQRQQKKVNILVATSGDTGGAVGHGFYGVEGIEVTILYPKNKVSELQEKQLTTIGGNVTTLEVDGNFDDCQHLVKTAFLDKDLNQSLTLSSANSINIARLIPQSFYYFHAFAQLQKEGKPIAYCVPSGNFGNLCGGLLAHKMGLPVEKFIVATNANDIVPQYLKSGSFIPKASLKTIANAMDVGNPSNFARMLALFEFDEIALKSKISGFAFDDVQNKEAIKEVYDKYNYTMCPHTAIAYLGAKAWQRQSNSSANTILLSTAHPAKFIDVVAPIIDTEIKLPKALAEAYDKEKKVVDMRNDFQQFKDFLLAQNQH